MRTGTGIWTGADQLETTCKRLRLLGGTEDKGGFHSRAAFAYTQDVLWCGTHAMLVL